MLTSVFHLRERLASDIMSKRCSVCQNLYEICVSCEQSSRRLVGCVEQKAQGFHDNGGFEGDVSVQKGGSLAAGLKRKARSKLMISNLNAITV